MNERKAGVILSYVNIGINALIGFVYIPMLLMFLTKEQYGLYQLVGSMISWMAIMDFGLGNTTVRYYSRYHAQHDEEKQENLLATMLRIYTGISLLVVFLGSIALYFFLPFYSHTLTPAEISTAKYVYWIMLFNLAIMFPANVFSAIIQSHEKFIFLRIVGIANALLQPILVFGVLHFKASIIALVIVQTVCNIAMFTTNVYYVLKKLQVRFHLHQWNMQFVKGILTFSFFIFLYALVDQVYWKTGQLILGAVSGTTTVTIYSVAIQLCMSFMLFSANISSVFLPRLSALAAQDNMQEINAIFLKIGRLQFYIVMLIFWGFLLFGRQFLHLWVGDFFQPAYAYGCILMAALIIPLVQNTGILILQAKNKHAFRSYICAIIAVLNVCISIPLSKQYGAMACACITAGSLLLGQGLILNIYYAKLGIQIGKFFRQIGKIGVVMLLPVALSTYLLCPIRDYPSALKLAGQIILFTTCYGLVIWTLAMNSYEKNLILAPLKKILNKC